MNPSTQIEMTKPPFKWGNIDNIPQIILIVVFWKNWVVKTPSKLKFELCFDGRGKSIAIK